MGVHDYVCYVQRNDQCLKNYEISEGQPTMKLVRREDEDDDPTESEIEWEEYDAKCFRDSILGGYEWNEETYGDANCISFLLPSSFTRKRIRKMDLRKFVRYPRVELTYDWGSWSFEELKGYEKALHKNSSIKQAI